MIAAKQCKGAEEGFRRDVHTQSILQVDNHKSAGMVATYTITGKQPAYHKAGAARRYYIQAVSTDAKCTLQHVTLICARCGTRQTLLTRQSLLTSHMKPHLTLKTYLGRCRHIPMAKNVRRCAVGGAAVGLCARREETRARATTQPFEAAVLPFVQSTNATIGSKYIKVRCARVQRPVSVGQHGPGRSSNNCSACGAYQLLCMG